MEDNYINYNVTASNNDKRTISPRHVIQYIEYDEYFINNKGKIYHLLNVK